ncbi:hypothetical protein KP509_02G047500 [Ceratopteris richardii]|uniref:Uncharacterized protein n=1 Tax=Ceratopteris richardii TaxID=49495 RepID=A0A8T2V9D7_CERRI|nr:hypothetical protein KP509_02G047500 [Ceratopteris richardii]
MRQLTIKGMKQEEDISSLLLALGPRHDDYLELFITNAVYIDGSNNHPPVHGNKSFLYDNEWRGLSLFR